jgi:hypothetical protein
LGCLNILYDFLAILRKFSLVFCCLLKTWSHNIVCLHLSSYSELLIDHPRVPVIGDGHLALEAARASGRAAVQSALEAL